VMLVPLAEVWRKKEDRRKRRLATAAGLDRDAFNTLFRNYRWEMVHVSKDGKSEKTFDALEWLTAIGSRVPNNRG
jgi:hypothetical protein